MAQDARKVRKVTRACDACKSKKKACTGTLPCGPCARRRLSCTYDAAYNRGVAASPLFSGHQRETPTPSSPSTVSQSRTAHTAHSQRIGSTESPLGGWNHQPSSYRSPGVSEEATPVIPSDPPEQIGPTHIDPQYWGPTSAHSFLGRVVQDLPTAPSKALALQPSQNAPSTVPIFSFGDRLNPHVRLADFQWPSRSVADKLVRRYFEFAAPTYRILHQPTIERLMEDLYQNDTVSIDPGQDRASQAIVLLIFGTAAMYQPDAEGHLGAADENGWVNSELYYAQADSLLSNEIGAPTLASVQARFLMVLYLLSSSRAHKAWFTFGTTVQLMMALGLHSKRSRTVSGKDDLIRKECQRRVLWCSYTLDKYLSIILGRPRLWQDEDIDEELPTRINDQDLTSHEISPSKCDCLMDAPVFHAVLARILTQAARESYVVTGISNKDQIDTIRVFCGRVAEWQAELPPFLSGIIQPGSLIPGLRRQLTVLQLARYHALIFITRPLLLRNYSQVWPECEASYQYYLSTCLTAARDAIELILAFVQEKQLFPSFWYSQYIAFNALSIIYLYLIQVQRGRISPANLRFVHNQDGPFDLQLDKSTLYKLCETTQAHLADATVRNAPAWKYSAILQGLRRELSRSNPSLSGSEHSESRSNYQVSASNSHTFSANAQNAFDYTQDQTHSMILPNNLSGPDAQPGDSFSQHGAFVENIFLDPHTEILFDNLGTDEELVPDFWSQFDSLPVAYH
ncbi:unnamed protein product [Penicillium salamii]|uniref:Zn(2)-C6 fungal-type domain-containing protein n=1 Tax=Penicillium salamii TaxID=1612424 RepID=A0A9W4NT97_9EURO|nr:unnamed protein product [Penicillium salamii]CAG8272070.1 unnamed protein product [Penicillium salamii]CAG8370029.1 unnamed protein product [Penicillium salamii]CAG8388429.1 unnamed protein product [Penicillium salamii]CAG8402328.1 unnamed protein product [Penicillium salamii]